LQIKGARAACPPPARIRACIFKEVAQQLHYRVQKLANFNHKIVVLSEI
jgi:hypothetical protein